VSVDGVEDIWIYDTSRGNATRFTLNEAGDSGWGIWSPDGSRMMYASARNGRLDFYIKPVGGGGEQSLLTSNYDKIPDDWSRDGRVIVYEVFAGRTKLDLWWLPVDGDRKPVPYLRTDFNEGHGRLSPDGKWLAYASDETGSSEIYVQSFPTPGNKILISSNGGDQPAWRRDGKELYYLAPDRKLMAVALKTGVTLETGEPKVLFQTRTAAAFLTAFRSYYAPAADGLKFLVATMPEDPSTVPLVMVLNWASGIAKP
jgi:Tol biopolymer transport system component